MVVDVGQWLTDSRRLEDHDLKLVEDVAVASADPPLLLRGVADEPAVADAGDDEDPDCHRPEVGSGDEPDSDVSGNRRGQEREGESPAMRDDCHGQADGVDHDRPDQRRWDQQPGDARQGVVEDGHRTG